MERSESLMSDAEESEKLELFVSCRNLADLDFVTVTDSFLVVKLAEPNKPTRQILKTKVWLDVYFLVRQRLTFEIWHESKPAKLVGKMETSLGEIFGSPEHGLVRDLDDGNNKKTGKIIVRCEKEEKTANKFINFIIKAKNLPSYKTWWFFGGTCSFFRLIRKRDKDELLVYESETVNYSTNPTFKEFKISERKLAKNDKNRQLEIRFYNYSSIGKHELIGSTLLTITQMEAQKQFKLMKGNTSTQNGTVIFEKIFRSIQYSFTDYIQANLQLALVTCIDFTASNGNPTQPSSLHYYNESKAKKSCYEEALEEVTNILIQYDYDKLVPVYGFGAKVNHPLLNSDGKVHHCFPINGNSDNPNMFGVEETIKEYRNILKYVTLSGPTYFAELFRQAISECKQIQEFHNQYMILFIITDGEIHDRQTVIDLLISCGRLPISVIIVGVGNSDFSIMHELDDDDCQMVDSNGKHTERDLVQFVEFKRFQNNGIELAREVLEELPRQVAEYYQLMGLAPEDIVKNIGSNHNHNEVKKMLNINSNNNIINNEQKIEKEEKNPYY